ncbi:hypothetical protein [Streptomyces rubiginosohelvolus]|nr:hypothetical protein OG475_34580 [Streptomyces rubiginosohelvolus]
MGRRRHPGGTALLARADAEGDLDWVVAMDSTLVDEVTENGWPG